MTYKLWSFCSNCLSKAVTPWDLAVLKNVSQLNIVGGEIYDAIIAQAAWLAAAQTTGKPIPTPTYRPAIYQTLSNP